MPQPIRLLVLVLFHLPVSLSSRHHRDRTPSAPSPSSSSPDPDASGSAPLAALLACNATRFKPACASTLSGAAPDASTADLLAATLSALRARLPPAVTTAKSVLASSSNVNLTNAATNCLTFLALSSRRLSPSPSPLLSASTALLHLYDCWSAYKYVNSSRAISDAMAYLDDTIAVNSNYISMLAARQRYGDDTSLWRPPQTERDGYWPPAAAASEADDVDALGVPKDLRANATVCAAAAGCDYRTVREAVAAAPDFGAAAFVVRVKEGVYRETVSVPWEKTNVVLVGDGIGKTVITGDLNADTSGVSTFNTATVGVLADGFMARDLTISDTAGPDAHQAVAFRSTGDRTVLDGVELLGHQDTLYAPLLHPVPRRRHRRLRLRQLRRGAPRHLPGGAAPAAAAGEGRERRRHGAGPDGPGAAHGGRAQPLLRERQRRVPGAVPRQPPRAPRVPGPALEGVLPDGVRRVHARRDRAAAGVDAVEPGTSRSRRSTTASTTAPAPVVAAARRAGGWRGAAGCQRTTSTPTAWLTSYRGTSGYPECSTSVYDGARVITVENDVLGTNRVEQLTR